MSVYSQYDRPSGRKIGKNKGVARQHKDRKYREAVARQEANSDRGYFYGTPGTETSLKPVIQRRPAPIDEFLRKSDRS